MEIFEKCPILFKAKEGENFNHPSTICRTYPGEMGIALHCREFHWAQRGRQEYIEYFED